MHIPSKKSFLSGSPLLKFFSITSKFSHSGSNVFFLTGVSKTLNIESLSSSIDATINGSLLPNVSYDICIVLYNVYNKAYF